MRFPAFFKGSGYAFASPSTISQTFPNSSLFESFLIKIPVALSSCPGKYLVARFSEKNTLFVSVNYTQKTKLKVQPE